MIGLLALFFFFLFLWQIVQAPLFFLVKDVHIEGNAYLYLTDIMNIGGFHYQDSFFKFSTQRIEDNLEKYAWIQTAEVKRKWPDTLNIVIEEKTPCLALSYYGSFIILADDGTVLDIKSDFSHINLPVLTGFKIDEVVISMPLIDNDIWYNIQRLMKSLSADVLWQISEVAWDKENISLYAVNGMEIRLGKPANIKTERLSLLPEIFEYIKDENNGYVDLTGMYAVYKNN